MNDDQFISAEPMSLAEVALELGLSVSSVSRLCAAGQLRAFNAGGATKVRWRVEGDAVERFKSERFNDGAA